MTSRLKNVAYAIGHIRLGRGTILVLTLTLLPIIFAAGYYRLFMHSIGENLFNQWSGEMRAPTPLIRLSVDLANPVQEWERNLYTKFQSREIDRDQLGEQLIQHYEVAVSAGDLSAWIARMRIRTCFLRFFVVWLYAPNAPAWARTLWERYAEATISLTLALLVVWLAWRLHPSRVTKHLPFLIILIFATAVRVYLLTRYCVPPSCRDFALGWALTSGYELYSKIVYYSLPVYAYLVGFVYFISRGSAFWIGMIPVLCSLIIITLAYLIVQRLGDRGAALITSGLLSFTPMLPWGLGANHLELPYLAFVMGSTYFLILYEGDKKHKHLALSGFMAFLALGTKQLAVASVATLLIYMLVRRDLRTSVPLFTASLLTPALCLFAFPLSPLLDQVLFNEFQVIPITLEQHVDRLLELLAGDPILTVSGFIGTGYSVLLGVSRKRGALLLFPMLVAASSIFLLFIMQYMDPHHCVFITAFLAVNSGLLLSRLGDLLGSTRLISSQRSAKIAKTVSLGWLVLGNMIAFAYPAITSEWNQEPYQDQYARAILQYTNPGDFVVTSEWKCAAVMWTGRRPIPELLWDTSPDRMSIIPPDLPAICETYSVKLLILDDFGKWELHADYLWKHYHQVGTIVEHTPAMPIYCVVLVRN